MFNQLGRLSGRLSFERGEYHQGKRPGVDSLAPLRFMDRRHG